MFKIDDHVVYGISGVCRIIEICHSPFNKADDRLFYVMQPLFGVGNATIYTPTDNELQKIRPLVSRAEAEALFQHPPVIETVKVEFEKKRRDAYHAVMMENSPLSYLKILKSVKLRRLETYENKKHLPDVDVEYEAKAKKCLCGELAVVLDREYADIESKIREIL